VLSARAALDQPVPRAPEVLGRDPGNAGSERDDHGRLSEVAISVLLAAPLA